MKKNHTLVVSFLAVMAIGASASARAEEKSAAVQANIDKMASVAIAPSTGVVTLVPRWSIGNGLGGFHHMAQDLSLGGEANDFYSIKGTTIPDGGDVGAFTLYVASSGAATTHADIGSKLTPTSYSALTSADPDVGYGSVNFYLIHHKPAADYFSVIVPGSGTSSAVTDLKPMSGPGGPSTLGGSGYFGLTFAAANLGYGLNRFYYLRNDQVTGFTKFGTLDPALLGTSADKADLHVAGYRALAFTGTDVGFGNDKMYYLRLDPITGFTIMGTLNPLTGRTADIANLGSVYTTLTFVPGDVGFGAGRFYTTGTLNPTWQSVSFAAIADRTLGAGSFTVSPSASSGLPITLSVVTGSATITGPVAGVFTVTPTAPGLVTLQATQAGQIAPIAYETNMLRQAFLVSGGAPDFNNDGHTDLLWRNGTTGAVAVWLMNGTAITSTASLGTATLDWDIGGTGDFNRDGHSDILWRNATTGAVALWLMNGTAIQSTVSVASIGAEWEIAGTGDFNNDGNVDILWRKPSSGTVALWLMDGTAIQSTATVSTIGAEWIIAGTGDFNGDGKVDILWRKPSTGTVALWLMNGSAIQSTLVVATVGADWEISGTGDMNGDAKVDILWRQLSTGTVAVWLMNGTAIQSTVSIATVSADWQIRN